MNCPECNSPAIGQERGYSETLVGYFAEDGHHHDDNCRKKAVVCANGHWWTISVRRTCKKPDCDWKGKLTCFCHPGEKVDKWPALPFRIPGVG